MIKKSGGSFWKPWRVLLSVLLLVAILVLGGWLLVMDKNIAVLNPQGVVGKQEKDLFVYTLLLSAFVVIPVFIMLGVFAWRYREGNHKAVYTPDVEGNHLLEAIWWGIPIFIIGVLSVVTWVTTHQLDPYKPLKSNVAPLNVQVVALQWKWLFIYPDQHIASLNQLRIPAGTPVNFHITADAPMSAMWIPSLGTQTYAMTGMSSQLSLMADKPGVYRGTNSNINGKGYADMNFDVIAMNSRQDFDAWVKEIVRSKTHTHLALDEYEELAKPSEKNPVAYYHVHDDNLYTEIMNKFMPAGHIPSGEVSDMHDHKDDH
jgi:cytochrome o ubiquinol oxidase subunit 2